MSLGPKVLCTLVCFFFILEWYDPVFFDRSARTLFCWHGPMCNIFSRLIVSSWLLLHYFSRLSPASAEVSDVRSTCEKASSALSREARRKRIPRKVALASILFLEFRRRYKVGGATLPGEPKCFWTLRQQHHEQDRCLLLRLHPADAVHSDGGGGAGNGGVQQQHQHQDRGRGFGLGLLQPPARQDTAVKVGRTSPQPIFFLFVPLYSRVFFQDNIKISFWLYNYNRTPKVHKTYCWSIVLLLYKLFAIKRYKYKNIKICSFSLYKLWCWNAETQEGTFNFSGAYCPNGKQILFSAFSFRDFISQNSNEP